LESSGAGFDFPCIADGTGATLLDTFSDAGRWTVTSEGNSGVPDRIIDAETIHNQPLSDSMALAFLASNAAGAPPWADVALVSNSLCSGASGSTCRSVAFMLSRVAREDARVPADGSEIVQSRDSFEFASWQRPQRLVSIG
jgi:hypothetical protein